MTPPQRPDALRAEELEQIWPILTPEERAESFRLLPRDEAEEFFLRADTEGQVVIMRAGGPNDRRIWMRLLAPDDAVDLLQEIPAEERPALLALLDEPSRREVTALLAYAEDDAAGLMTPRFARVRPDMTVDEAISYLRRQAHNQIETIYYAYALDREQKLLGVVSFRELFAASRDRKVSEVMNRDFVSVLEDMDQEAVAQAIAHHDLLAVPVVDAAGRMKGIVTVDDVVDVVQSEATEDIQKISGMEALDTPYLQTGFFEMVRKRAGWLAVLFIGETFTASAMGAYQGEIQAIVFLSIFLPLILSSGGNSGSQASTLVIRAMALGEVRLRDWWRIIRRELASGFVLGLILAAIGLVRVLAWQKLGFQHYGQHYGLVAVTVALSLVGVVTWGTFSGSMLPFVLRRLGFDPASASAPFVATIVDVCGLVIYFTVARLILLPVLA